MASTTTANLAQNSPATVAVSFNDLFSPSEEKMFNILKTALYPFAEIQKVDRPLFSSRFVVTFIPRSSRTALSWMRSITAALESQGYSPEIQGNVQGGYETTEAGGLLSGAKNLITQAGDAPVISQTLSTVKLASIAIIGVVSVIYLAPLLTRRKRR